MYYYNWVQNNIKKVSDATKGEVGYLHVPDMLTTGLNEFVKHFEQFAVRGECSGIAINVNRSIVPRGNNFAGCIVRGRNVSVRAVEDDECVPRTVLEIFPMRIGFGNVSAEVDLISGFANDEWHMTSEWTFVNGRYQDCERVGAHESERGCMIADSEVFGYVHEVSF